jgi:hypothetical protein
MTSTDTSSIPYSINDTLKTFGRKRLLRTPPYWTSYHLAALNCQFRDEPSTYSASLQSARPSKSSPKLHEGSHSADINHSPYQRSILQLQESRHPAKKHHALRQILKGSSIAKSSIKDLNLYYAGRPVFHFPHLQFFEGCGSNNKVGYMPILAFVDYNEILLVRKRAQESNPLVYSEITVEEWSQDPYILFILISVAQAQNRARKLSSYKSSLLMTSCKDPDYIHIYEAEIARLFLRKFAQPNRKGVAPILIRHRLISFEPYTTFETRLVDELALAPTVLNNETIERMDFARPTPCILQSHVPISQKRPRENDDDERDSDGEPRKKRR